jgi:hypothetical protein
MCCELTGPRLKLTSREKDCVRDSSFHGRHRAAGECSCSYTTAACARVCSATRMCCANNKFLTSHYTYSCCLCLMSHAVNCAYALRPCRHMCLMCCYNYSTSVQSCKLQDLTQRCTLANVHFGQLRAVNVDSSYTKLQLRKQDVATQQARYYLIEDSYSLRGGTSADSASMRTKCHFGISVKCGHIGVEMQL